PPAPQLDEFVVFLEFSHAVKSLALDRLHLALAILIGAGQQLGNVCRRARKRHPLLGLVGSQRFDLDCVISGLVVTEYQRQSGAAAIGAPELSLKAAGTGMHAQT